MKKDFGRIQIDRVLEMQKWADNIKNIQDESVNLAIIGANNHYAGFGPGTGEYISKYDGITRCKVATKGRGGTRTTKATPGTRSRHETNYTF